MSLREVGMVLRRSRPDLPVTDVLTYFYESYEGIDTPYFVDEVARAISRVDLSRASVLEVLRVLAAEPFRLLDERLRFVHEDGGKIEVSRDEVAEAVASGTFRHPHTGARIADWAERIETWFESRRLDDVFACDAPE